MNKSFAVGLVLYSVLFLGAIGGAHAQQPPKTTRSGDSVSIIRNDSQSSVSIECHNNNQWQEMKLEPGKDVTVAGDRVRVATTRPDNATVTVDLPIQAGKKYRLVWNAPSGIWDFSPVS